MAVDLLQASLNSFSNLSERALFLILTQWLIKLQYYFCNQYENIPEDFEFHLLHL